MVKLITLISFIFCCLAFYAVGRRTLLLCGINTYSLIEDWVISTSLGAIIIANIVMLAGFAHILHVSTFIILIFISIIFNISIIYTFLRRTFNCKFHDNWHKLDIWEKYIILIIILYIIIRFINTFAPVVTWDATTHHYLIPAMYLKAGAIYDIPHVLFSYYPSMIEMLFLLGMGLSYSDLLSSQIGWLFGPLTLGAVYIFGIKFLNKRIGLIAGAILLSLGGIGIQMDGGYVDLAQGLFCILCLYKLMDWRSSNNYLDLLLAALFFSANLAAKHLGFAFFIPVLLFIIYISIYERKSGLRKTIIPLMIFFGVALVLPLPWYIRAYILKANPFYPFPVFGFPTLRYPPLEITTWVNPGFKKNIVTLITYLWYLTTDLRLDEALGKRFTPYFLGMLPFFWVALRKGAFLPGLLFLISLYFMGFVFFFAPVSTRYMLLFLPFMSILAADIINTIFLRRAVNLKLKSIYIIPVFLVILFINEIAYYFSYGPMVIILDFILKIIMPGLFVILLIIDIMHSYKGLKGTLNHMLAIIVIFLIFIPLITRITETATYIKDHNLKVILGIWDKDRYLSTESPRNWGAIKWMNNNLPDDSKILAIETRMYGLQRQWITWLGLEDEPIPTTPEDNVRLWKKYNFTHVWIGDDATTKTLMFYNIYNLPGNEDEVIFRLQDLWYDFFGHPFTRSIISKHFREYWLPRELKIQGYEWYENGKRMTDEYGHPLYKALRSSIAANRLMMAQIYFVDSIRELEKTGGLHIVYPPPDGKIKEELTFILKTDYETYKKVHEQVQAIGG